MTIKSPDYLKVGNVIYPVRYLCDSILYIEPYKPGQPDITTLRLKDGTRIEIDSKDKHEVFNMLDISYLPVYEPPLFLG